MEILLEVRHNHHQGVPTFECKSTNWEDADHQLTEGLELIRNKNQVYIERNERQNALICGIIDFVISEESKVTRGQFGFDINHVNKSIKEIVEWYLGLEQTVENVG